MSPYDSTPGGCDARPHCVPSNWTFGFLRKRPASPFRAACAALAVIVLAAIPVAAAPPTIPANIASNNQADRMDAEIEKHFDDNHLPGLVVLLGRDGGLTYKKCLGFSDKANQVKMTEHRVGRLNSVSKFVAAILSLQQVEKGNLNLNTTAKSYLPDLPAQHTYKVRDLLACRSGVRHYNEPVSPQSPTNWSNNQFDTDADAIPMFWNDPLASPVGAYHYSTHGYTILGACLEQVSHKSVPNLIRTELSQKYGLSTLAAEDHSANVPERMTLYQWKGRGPRGKLGRNVEFERDNESWKRLGGGIESSPLDLLKLGMLLGDGKIISKANVDKMMTRIDPLESYALGCSTATENGYHVMAKSGSYPGSNAYIWLVPELRMVMVLMANRDGAGVSDLGNRLRTILLNPDKASSTEADLVVQNFERTAAPYYKNGYWQIPVRFKVVNQGIAGASISFVNGVQIGTTYHWSGFMDALPGKGASDTATGVVKVSDASKLLAGRTLKLVAYADAPIAAGDTSTPSWGRIDESNDANNKATLNVKLPGNGLGGLTGTAPANDLPSTNGSSGPQRVPNGGRTQPPRLGRLIRGRQRPQRVPEPSTVPQRRPSINLPGRVPGRPAAIAKADLEIRSIRFAPRQPQVAVAVVVNSGQGPARASVLRLTVRKIGGAAAGRTVDAKVPALAPGKSAVVSIDASSILPNRVALKSATFLLDADSTSVVAESDETNNLKWHNK